MSQPKPPGAEPAETRRRLQRTLVNKEPATSPTMYFLFGFASLGSAAWGFFDAVRLPVGVPEKWPLFFASVVFAVLGVFLVIRGWCLKRAE